MTTTQLINAEDLWHLPETPGKRFELVKGDLVEVAGTGGVHGVLALWIGMLLLRFVRERDLGVVCSDGAGYVISRDPDTVRIPDVSFVAQDRVPEGGIPKRHWPLAPDLAVEIISPEDTASAVWEKVHEYLAARVRLVWVVWPDGRRVTAYRNDGTFSAHGADDELDGGDVLPGFGLRVAALFEAV